MKIQILGDGVDVKIYNAENITEEELKNLYDCCQYVDAVNYRLRKKHEEINLYGAD